MHESDIVAPMPAGGHPNAPASRHRTKPPRKRDALMQPGLLLSLAIAGLACSSTGCMPSGNTIPPEPALSFVQGKVTVQGKPLAQAVVTFLQVDEKGTLSVGETDEEGAYELTHMGRPGAAAADYKVVISYLVGTDGTVYGLGPRSGLAKPYGLFSAKELIVPEWSDFGKSTHRATVSGDSATLDFDIQEPLLPAPSAPPAAAEVATPALPDPAKSEIAAPKP
jgi:hypothetical protein